MEENLILNKYLAIDFFLFLAKHFLYMQIEMARTNIKIRVKTIINAKTMMVANVDGSNPFIIDDPFDY